MLAVAVTAAGIHDSAAGTQLLTKVAEHHPTVIKAWADNGYKTKTVAQRGIDLQIVQRDPTTRGFQGQPRRWVIERTLGWLMHRRPPGPRLRNPPPPLNRNDPTRRHQPHDPRPHP